MLTIEITDNCTSFTESAVYNSSMYMNVYVYEDIKGIRKK